MDNEKMLENRFLELSEHSYLKGIYTYTDFLGLKEQSVFNRLKGLQKFSVSGGCNLCERVMIRFGDETTTGYNDNFPISCISINPLSEKFAENFSHRDILGSIMALGVERSKIGDIFINPNGKNAFLFCCDSISDYLCSELIKTRHTSIKCSVVSTIPFDPQVNLKNVTIRVKSERADCLVSSLYNLSRDNSKKLFLSNMIFLNGIEISGSKKVPKGSIISVRGYGRFIYDGIESISKKGNLWVKIKKVI